MTQAIPQDPPLMPNGRFSTAWQRYFIGLNTSGAGTVTSVSIVPANGISGTVGTATTTPAITLALGNITPTQVASTGTVTGTNLSGTSSGTNTGDQTISIGGDVTAAGGTGALSATVTKVNGVSFAGLITGILKNTTGTGVPSIAVAADFPTLNQNTTGTAANVTGIVLGANGGTGIANTGKTVTLGGNLATSGAFASTFTMTGVTTVTFPTTGTLATLAGSETLSSKTLTAPTINGGTASSLTGFSLRNAGVGAFDMTMAHNGTLSAGRTLTWNLADTSSTISIGGNVTIPLAFTITGSLSNVTFNIAGTTNITLPNSGTMATLAGTEALSNKTITASSFAGTTVAATTSVLSSGTGGVGYSTGAGGAVTQITSKATGVTLSKTCGVITMNAASLGASTTVSFTLTNTLIAATDTIHVHRASGGTAAVYNVWVDSVAAGSCVISVRNLSAGALLEAVVLNFSIIKAVNA